MTIGEDSTKPRLFEAQVSCPGNLHKSHALETRTGVICHASGTGSPSQMGLDPPETHKQNNQGEDLQQEQDREK